MYIIRISINKFKYIYIYIKILKIHVYDVIYDVVCEYEFFFVAAMRSGHTDRGCSSARATHALCRRGYRKRDIPIGDVDHNR